MKTPSLAILLAAAALLASAHARDSLMIVGSSTVYPFSTVVAERFGRTAGLGNPTVESTGTGGGMKLFCKGIGVGTPDITNASRRIKGTEFELCQRNGVREIVEVLIGYDGIVIANSREAGRIELTRRDLFLALAKDVPDPAGVGFVPNPHRRWSDVNPALPPTEIRVFGPPPTSGTRDAFAELALEGGCETFESIKALKDADKPAYKARCHSVREDGAYVESGENDNLIIQKLLADESALGIFGFSFLDQNGDKVQGGLVDGHEPTFEAIAAGDYPVSRPLYFYVKKAHVGLIPGVAEYVDEFVGDRAIGEEGYLVDRGLIPLGGEARKAYLGGIASIKPLSM